MYKGREVLNKLDGLGEVVCHYRQKAGHCTGVALEWLRRALVEDDTQLLPTQPDLGYGLGLADKLATDAREAQWGGMQKSFAEVPRDLFRGALKTPGDALISENKRQVLDRADTLLEGLEDALRQGTRDGIFKVPSGALAFAKRRGFVAQNFTGLTKDALEKTVGALKAAHARTADLAFTEWLSWPAEMRMLREFSQDVVHEVVDEKAAVLRARFSQLSLVAGVNTVSLRTGKAVVGMAMALRSPHFTLGRGMALGVGSSKGPGHKHALVYQEDGPAKYVWIDPNYGVWRMTREKLLEAVRFLYDETGQPGEKGVYQVNGLLVPTGYEYSIWERRT